jgi:hypothetical protein
MKSYRPKDGSGEPPASGGGRNREADFHGQKRSNETHASTTDPEARLYRKGPGKEAKLCFMGHALMENRNGLFVDACLTEANGHAERIAALHMIEPRADRPRPITLGADKAYDAEDFVNELRSMNATPHVAQNTRGRSSAIDGRTTRHAGYAASQPRQPPTIWRGCRISWRLQREGSGELPPDRPLADRRGRPLGSRLPRPLRSGDADRHSAGRRNRLWSHGGWVSMSNTPATRSASAGPDATKATRSEAKEPPNSSTQLHRNRVRLRQRRRSRPQSQTRLFFNNLLAASSRFRRSISLAQSCRARCATGRRQRVEVGRTLIELPKSQSRGKQAYEAPLGKDRRPGENRRSIAG